MYVWYKKQSHRIHLADDNGRSLCQLENGGWEAWGMGDEKPEGRKVCTNCQALANHPRQTKFDRKNFFHTPEWAWLKQLAFKLYGEECVVCRSTENLNVAHIVPAWKAPDLALEIVNVQVMCWPCCRDKWAGREEVDMRYGVTHG